MPNGRPTQQPCTEIAWIQQNESSYNWYYETYPLFESGIILPVSMNKLKMFYITDMLKRNLTPLDEYVNCYDNLFSYMIGRVDGMINFEGSNWFERLIKAAPAAFEKTIEDITSPFGIPLIFWGVGTIAVILLLKN